MLSFSELSSKSLTAAFNNCFELYIFAILLAFTKAGNYHRYFMVFDNSPIANAQRLDDITSLVAQMLNLIS